MVSGAVILQPDLEQCACQDCVEAYLAARQAARVSALRSPAIRAYQRGQRDFALGFTEEILPGWDE